MNPSDYVAIGITAGMLLSAQIVINIYLLVYGENIKGRIKKLEREMLT